MSSERREARLPDKKRGESGGHRECEPNELIMSSLPCWKGPLNMRHRPSCPSVVPRQLRPAASVMSSCSIPANPDIAGVGVRAAIYAQVLLSFVPAVSAIWDKKVTRHELQSVETQSTTTLILAFGILISCIVQAFTLGLTNFHASIVLSMSWMNNTNVFIYFLLYVQRETQEGVKAQWSAWRRHIADAWGTAFRVRTSSAVQYGQPELVAEARGARVAIFKRVALLLGSLHLTMMAALGIWLWSDPQSFGTSSGSGCSVERAHLAILGVSVPFGSRRLRIISLALYSLFLLPGINLILPMVAFLSLYILRNASSDPQPRPDADKSNIQEPPQAYPFHKSPITPVCVGLAVLLAIDIVFVADIELTLRRNRDIQIRGEADWGFGQVLAVLLLLVPLRDVIEMLLARNERQKKQEILEALLGTMNDVERAASVIELLQQGADHAAKSKDGNHTVLEALARGAQWEQIELLVNTKSLDINEYFCSGLTALEVASDKRDWEGVSILIKLSANIGAEFKDGSTALDRATVSEQWELVCELVEKAARVNMSFKEERMGSTLRAACKMGGPIHVTALLLEHGANPNSRGTSGSTPLHLACSDGHIECVDVLIKHNADVNARDKRGRVPLHNACSKQSLSCVKKLLDFPADPCQRDRDGKAPSVRELLLTSPHEPDLAGRLHTLGTSFFMQFQRTDNSEDMDEAISALREVRGSVSAGYARLHDCLNSLGCWLAFRSQATGNLDDIAEAVSTQRRAVELTPECHADLPRRLENLGCWLVSRFVHTSDLDEITEAIVRLQRAVELTPENDAGLAKRWNDLGISFWSRFVRTGDANDIGEAIAAQQRAITLTPKGHVDLPGRLNNLGSSFQSRFQLTEDMHDITQAIANQQEAIHLTPEDHADLPPMFNNLGNALQSRYKCTGDISDINQAINAHETAILFTPIDSPALPGMLSNLGNALQNRFMCTGDTIDITKAVSQHQTAIWHTPEGHADLPGMLLNLGNSFRSRFQQTGDMTDITEAITAQKRAISLTPEGHADLPRMLSNLGSSLQSRFQRIGDMTDISEAITAQQRAISLTPEGHADLTRMLINLHSSFQSRFEQTGDISDASEAIAAQQSAILLTPGGRADLPGMLSNLGNTFQQGFRHAEVVAAFETFFHLLTLRAELEKNPSGHHGDRLKAISRIASEAAAAACRLGQLNKAVEWLEHQRRLVWGQLNLSRTPMDDLRQKDSQLALRITQAIEQLDFTLHASGHTSLGEPRRSNMALAKEWEGLLSAVRKLSGLESFPLTSPCSVISRALPESGTIVILNSHQDGYDAIALSCESDEPLHIPLPDFSLEKARQYWHMLNGKLHSRRMRAQEEIENLDNIGENQGTDITPDQPNEGATHDDAVNEVLRGLWLEVAKPVLDTLEYSRYDPSTNLVPPRIWWCATGVVSTLPIHAAGIHGGTDSECLMDYAVSSYTPCVAAIIDRVESPCQSDTRGLFLTSQPKPPGAAEIRATTREVDEVFAKAVAKGVKPLKYAGDDVSVEECLKYMGEFTSVHLACHASENASNPLQSRFLLHRGELSLLSIILMDMKNADLAFMSARQTSIAEGESEGTTGLAAGLLAAGYRKVVAMMWSVNDSHAPGVATDFYDYLLSNRDARTSDGQGDFFDTSLSAHALHHAVQQLRQRLGDSEMDLLTWVSYVHFGY